MHKSWPFKSVYTKKNPKEIKRNKKPNRTKQNHKKKDPKRIKRTIKNQKELKISTTEK